MPKFLIGPKKKTLFVSDFRPTLSKQVRPKFTLWIFQKKTKNQKKKKKFQENQKLREELPTVIKVTLT